MLRTLLESQAAPNRRAGGTLISIAVHTGMIALAVVATARASAGPPTEEPIDPRPVFVVSPTPRPNNDAPLQTSEAKSPVTIVLDGRVLVPPVKIPDHLPNVDWSRPAVDDSVFRGGGGTGSLGGGVISLSSGRDSVYTMPMVEKAAAARPDNPAPAYPSALRAAQIEGSVVARFIVDTAGRAEPASIGFPSATHEQFAEAVRQALLRSRYLPAMIGGKPVRQLVEQRFEFALRR